jgi:hypothetical protein
MRTGDDDAPTLARSAIGTGTTSDTAETRALLPMALADRSEASPRFDERTFDRIATQRGAPMARLSRTVVRPLATGGAGGTTPARSGAPKRGPRALLAVLIVGAGLGAAFHWPWAAHPDFTRQARGTARAKEPLVTPSTAHTAAPAESRFPEAVDATDATDATPEASTEAASASARLPVLAPSEAARLLATGAYAEALHAYRSLADEPHDPDVYALIARVLERNLTARCHHDPLPGDSTCPPDDATRRTAPVPSAH